jgi:hypothetical protein
MRSRAQGNVRRWRVDTSRSGVGDFAGVYTRVGSGRLSVFFDWGSGSGAPHWARGCPAHAAAVGELLRAYVEDVLGKNPGRAPGVQEPPLRPR